MVSLSNHEGLAPSSLAFMVIPELVEGSNHEGRARPSVRLFMVRPFDKLRAHHEGSLLQLRGRNGATHSILVPVALMIGAHLAISSVTNFALLAGVESA